MAQIFPPSANTLARASTVGCAPNPNALGVDHYALTRSSTPPRTDFFCTLPEGVPRTPMMATKDKLPEEKRMRFITNHHTHSRGGKAAEHTP